MSDGQINLFAGNFRHVQITDSLGRTLVAVPLAFFVGAVPRLPPELFLKNRKVKMRGMPKSQEIARSTDPHPTSQTHVSMR